jgi:hypothetical protein
MTEAEYWIHLELRLCREFAGLPESRHRYLWCDGFNPMEYLFDDAAPRITGRAWICDGPRQKEWQFALLLPRPTSSRDYIDWASLLPPDNKTRWISIEQDRLYIEIEPAAAKPDFF